MLIAVEYGRSHETYQGVRHIGIDEISRKKGHTYHTVVYDLDRRRLLWSGADRSKDSLIRFFELVGSQKEQKPLKGSAAICGKVILTSFINIVARLWLSSISSISFATCWRLWTTSAGWRVKALSEKYPELLKNTRYIWLKNPWNLT